MKYHDISWNIMQYNEIPCFGRADSGRPRVLDLVGLEHETGPGGQNGIWVTESA